MQHGLRSVEDLEYLCRFPLPVQGIRSTRVVCSLGDSLPSSHLSSGRSTRSRTFRASSPPTEHARQEVESLWPAQAHLVSRRSSLQGSWEGRLHHRFILTNLELHRD